MKQQLSFLMVGLLLFQSSVLKLSAQLVEDNPSKNVGNEPHHIALLVGCSEYQDSSIRSLPGCANDVRIFEQILKNKFDFQDITVLSGWSGDQSTQPSFANISKAFDSLVKKARLNSQVFILLSGHGTQFPLPEHQKNVLDPRNPEPDGLDEAFLPADYAKGERMVLDDQIGEWLSALKNKGAHVWITFDSCHSGTMMRSSSEEAAKRLTPQQAGISQEKIQAAKNRAAKQLSNSPKTIELFDKVQDKDDDSGSVVLFYAAQDFETAPEVTRPRGVENKQENRHGLLSWHLQQTLYDLTEGISFHELGKRVMNSYRADRGSTPPTPYFEGKLLEREVFGLKTLPKLSYLSIDRKEDSSSLQGGSLNGIAVGDVLSVHPPDDKAQETVLGFVEVSEVALNSSKIVSIACEKLEKKPITIFPDGASCKVVSRNLSTPKLQIFTSADQDLRSKIPTAKKLLQELTDQAVVELCNSSESADWILDFVSIHSAKNKYDCTIELPSLLLVEPTTSALNKLEGKVRAVYSVETLGQSNLPMDLKKIYRWGLLWKIATAYSANAQKRTDASLQLDLRKLTGPKDTSKGKVFNDTRIESGSCLLAQVINHDYDPYWYTVLFFNSNFGIELVAQGSINRKPSIGELPVRELERMQVTSDSVGVEGYFVIATSQRTAIIQPDYSFLAQTDLEQEDPPKTIKRNSLRTPFDQYLLKSVDGRAKMRSNLHPTNPQISSWSWVTTTSNEK